MSSKALMYSFNDIFVASRVGDIQWLQKVLNFHKNFMEMKDNVGFSCLHVAAINCTFNSLKFLIENLQVDVNVKTQCGWTALHLCINNTNKEKSFNCMKYLISQSANIQSKTDTGLTALHLASAVGNYNQVEMLLKEGSIVDSIDSFGKTPLSFAIVWGHRDVARYLEHHTWFKRKKDEFKTKRDFEKYTEKLQEELKEKQEILETERRINAELSFKAWHEKNNFVYNPFLFGQISYNRENLNDQSSKSNQQTNVNEENAIDISKRSNNNKTIKSNEVLYTKTNDRNVHFLPLSDFYK